MIAENENMGTGSSCKRQSKVSIETTQQDDTRVVKIIHFNDVYNIEVHLSIQIQVLREWSEMLQFTSGVFLNFISGV